MTDGTQICSLLLWDSGTGDVAPLWPEGRKGNLKYPFGGHMCAAILRGVWTSEQASSGPEQLCRTAALRDDQQRAAVSSFPIPQASYTPGFYSGPSLSRGDLGTPRGKAPKMGSASEDLASGREVEHSRHFRAVSWGYPMACTGCWQISNLTQEPCAGRLPMTPAASSGGDPLP